MNVAAANTRNVVSLFETDSGGSEICEQRVVIPAAQRRMSFLRRAEILLDSKMNLHGSALKPAAAAFRQLRRLGDFRHAQHATKERTRNRLLPGRHGELHVVNGEELRGLRRDRHACVSFAGYFFGSGFAVGGSNPFRRR